MSSTWSKTSLALALLVGILSLDCHSVGNLTRSNMTKFERELAANRRAWERSKASIRRRYPGLFVGLAWGDVVASGKTYEAVEVEVYRRAPGASHFAICRAESEPIWGIVRR